MSPLRAVVFDMDGVIISSEEGTFTLLQRIMKRHDFKLDDSLYPRRIGKKIKKFLEEVYGPELPPDMTALVLGEFYEEYLNHIERYASPINITTQFLRKYEGNLKLGLASASDLKAIVKVLAYLGLTDRFDYIASADHVMNIKPHPEIYLVSAKKLGVAVGACAAIEDSVVGAEAAIRAGLQTYVFLNGTNSEADFASLPTAGFLSSAADFRQLTSSTLEF